MEKLYLYQDEIYSVLLRQNLKNLNRVAEPPKPVPIERRLKSQNTEYNFK